MGRAGRPQFDDSAVAVIYVHDVKKHFYKKFLYEPFPLESRFDGGGYVKSTDQNTVEIPRISEETSIITIWNIHNTE